MKPDIEALVEERVRFSGRVIASVSHELKNALATVGESAGLLSDLLADQTVDDEVKDDTKMCVEAITDELHRAFEIVATLNAFAHTADEAACEVEVDIVLRLAATLAGYLSTSRPMSVSAASVRVRTSPMLLTDLLYGILESAFRARRGGAAIEATVVERDGGAEILLRGLGVDHADEVLTDAGRRVLEALQARGEFHSQTGMFGVRLPASIESGDRT